MTVTKKEEEDEEDEKWPGDRRSGFQQVAPVRRSGRARTPSGRTITSVVDEVPALIGSAAAGERNHRICWPVVKLAGRAENLTLNCE